MSLFSQIFFIALFCLGRPFHLEQFLLVKTRISSELKVMGKEEKYNHGFYKRSLPTPPAVEFSSSEGKCVNYEVMIMKMLKSLHVFVQLSLLFTLHCVESICETSYNYILHYLYQRHITTLIVFRSFVNFNSLLVSFSKIGIKDYSRHMDHSLESLEK
ncbi:hypothetical protein RchiOBHm_Chr6g0287521 [Rosa chinensis]|uniref:Uncharacterized protein n=1 Tax=Rosa chinensis TaxID=74649 RepID=A0A2P6PV34_ROSCH|nr:hypothetical protein RchiOBHm_Chr6g0287521 [Rosa chinensis]